MSGLCAGCVTTVIVGVSVAPIAFKRSTTAFLPAYMLNKKYWSEPRRHDRKRHRAAAANKLVPILATRRASKDGCRFRCVLCVVGRGKADRRGPKRQRSYLPWQVGACVICLHYCTYVVYTYTKLKLGIPSLCTKSTVHLCPILTGLIICVLFSQGKTFVSYSHRATLLCPIFTGQHFCVLFSHQG